MKKQTSLTVILIFAIAGLLFSGYFSFSEVFTGKCAVGGCAMVFGIPTCVYGFVMYLIIFIFALIGICKKN